MARYTDPLALLRGQTRQFDAAMRAVEAIQARAVRSVVEHSDDLLSGGVSTATLRAMGHPFSRRRFRSLDKGARAALRGRRTQRGRWELRGAGLGGLPTLPINRQTGRLLRDQRLSGTRVGPGSTRWTHSLDAPYAGFVLAEKGTRSMIARGYRKEMDRRWKRISKQAIHDSNLAILRVAVTVR